MSNINRDGDDQYYIEELSELSAQAQANTLASFYASTRNQFQAVKEDKFSDILSSEVRQNVADILTTPQQIEDIILSMNKKAACINGDIPLEIIHFLVANYQSHSVTFSTQYLFQENTQKSGKPNLLHLLQKSFHQPKFQQLGQLAVFWHFQKSQISYLPHTLQKI